MKSENNYPDLGSAKLSLLFFKQEKKIATINEYSTHSGLTIPQILLSLDPFISNQTLTLEAIDGEVFVNTLPRSMPGAPDRIFPPNLWECLRKNAPILEAARYYKVYRELQFSGWVPGVRETIALEPTALNIQLGELKVPLIDKISLQQLSFPDNIISDLEINGLNLVAVIAPEGQLEKYVTAIRSWYLNRSRRSEMDIILLEAPRYTPVVLTSDDSAISPLSITLDKITNTYTVKS